MKSPTPYDAALAWSALGLKWLEMMTASGLVIARRTTRRNTPGQLFTMGSEKMLGAAACERHGAVPRASDTQCQAQDDT